MHNYDPRQALADIWETVTCANQFVEEHKPWVLAKDPSRKTDLARVLVLLAECVAHLAVLLLAFLPEAAEKILARLKLPLEWRMEKQELFQRPFLSPGTPVERGPALFPRLEEK